MTILKRVKYIYMKFALMTALITVFYFNSNAESLKTIKLCSTSFAPWIVDTEAIVTGISPQLINLIFSKSKIKEPLKFTAIPFDRCLSGVKDGTFDGVFFLTMVEERKEFLTYSESYVTDESFIFYSKEKPLKQDIIHNLKTYKVGIQRGLKYGEGIDKIIKQKPKNFNFTTRVTQLVEMLNRGRIDFFITSQAQYFDLRKKNPKALENIQYDTHLPLSSGKYHLSFSNNSQYKKYLPIINKTIEELKASKYKPLAQKF